MSQSSTGAAGGGTVNAAVVGRFVGVGIGSYTLGTLKTLPRAAVDVAAVGRLVGPILDARALIDPDKTALDTYLAGLPDTLAGGGALVGMWSGHGVASPVGVLQLPASNATRVEFGNVTAQEFVAACVSSGANQVLIVLDTCYSGEAAVDAAVVATELFAARPPEGERVWVGILTACQPWEKARDGALGQMLCRLLEHGPATPDLRLYRWSAHQRLLRGDDVCDALVKELSLIHISEPTRPY